MPLLDQGLPLLTKGYAWLPDLRRRVGRRAFRIRLGGMPAAVVEGPDGVRWFYDEDHVRRAGALPFSARNGAPREGTSRTLGRWSADR